MTEADQLYASYSAGVGTDVMQSLYLEWLSEAERVYELCYSDKIDLVSLCVLLSPGESAALRVSALIMDKGDKDSLLCVFNDWLCKGQIKALDGEIKYPEYAGLQKVLSSTDKTIQSTSLRDYMRKEWYPANSGSAWYESHLGKHDTYVGYWCFVGAAIGKSLSLDKGYFEDIIYFPKDLY